MNLSYIRSHHKEYISWRHHLHSHPELSFEEHKSTDYICNLLDDFGISYQRLGNKGLGIVGYLHKKDADDSSQAIGLRADIDALPIEEENTFAHCSKNSGVMHACGHDGHTAMLLGAAQYFARHRNELKQNICFIFQPAEEQGGGAVQMIKEGLFKHFSIKSVYGMHNWPGINIGKFAICKGPIMAAVDFFDIRITGEGGHAAMPQHASDPVIAAAQIISQIQTIVSRNTAPTDSLVISVTSINGGNAYNVIPTEFCMKGTIRYFNKSVCEKVLERMQAIIIANCRSNNLDFKFDSHTTTPATINHSQETETASQAAQEIGELLGDIKPSMGGEDFAYMLEEKPGAYIWLGNGNSAPLHTPKYDFNDEALISGVQYWVSIANKLQ